LNFPFHIFHREGWQLALPAFNVFIQMEQKKSKKFNSKAQHIKKMSIFAADLRKREITIKETSTIL
jgi:hypothetical protein